MADISILNDVLGPVMRGPSSSHTAGSYHIALVVTGLLGCRPRAVRCAFDPEGSYGRVYREQGVDRALAAGFLGRPLTDPAFADMLDVARESGLDLRFSVEPLPGADHPNTAVIVAEGEDGRRLTVTARSVGGGAIEIVRLDGWPVRLDGSAHALLVEIDAEEADRLDAWLRQAGGLLAGPERVGREGRTLVSALRASALTPSERGTLDAFPGARRLLTASPYAFVKRGRALASSASGLIEVAGGRGCSLGQAALSSEAALLGIPETEVLDELVRRFGVMREAVTLGLSLSAPPMQLLGPSARSVFEAEAAGRVAIGGLHTRAAARALAVMHVNGGMGVVCAAPTAGSAGTIPGIAVTLAEERGVGPKAMALALAAAGAVGAVVGSRATFAAEVAGCQVEIGAAGAMGAALVVEAAGGTARQAADAAAIAFQNTMGMVCDLVQGTVEIPCHTRNAVAASSAFVCADLVLGGYVNPIPLDETIDAVMAVGRMMPSDLRCTSRGGLAVTPSALRIRPRR